jgi:hypothetical protein
MTGYLLLKSRNFQDRNDSTLLQEVLDYLDDLKKRPTIALISEDLI